MRSTHLAWFLVAALVVPGLASAQTVQAFERLPDQLNAGDRVRIVDASGRERTGAIAALTPDQLALARGGGATERIARVDVREVWMRRRDPVRNGALIGFIPGFVMGTQFVLGFSDHDEPLTTYFMAGGIVGLGGAGIGALIDSLHEGLRPIYRAERKTAVTVAPVVGRGRLGAAAALRW